MILWIAGPSSSGKSFATDAVINEMIGTMNHNTDPSSDNTRDGNQKNHIVSIDGGISRAISQMRQLVLQAALRLGYTGIEDLETHTNKIKLKNEIIEAAVADNNPAQLSLAIPCTFTQPSYYWSMVAYSTKNDAVQVFCEVTGEDKEFKNVVNFLGNSRTWMSTKNVQDQLQEPITINNHKIGCESKKYEAEYFIAGVIASQQAKFLYQMLPGTTKTSFIVKNDLVFLKPVHNNSWETCTTISESQDSQTIKTSKRMFTAWKQYSNTPNTKANVLSLQEWISPVYVQFNNKWKECSEQEVSSNPSQSMKITNGEFLLWQQTKTTAIDLPEWLKKQNLTGPLIENTSSQQEQLYTETSGSKIATTDSRIRANALKNTEMDQQETKSLITSNATISITTNNYSNGLFDDNTWQKFSNSIEQWYDNKTDILSNQATNLKPLVSLDTNSIIIPIKDCSITVERIISTNECTIKAEKYPATTAAIENIIKLAQIAADIAKSNGVTPIFIETNSGSLEEISLVLNNIKSHTEYASLINIELLEIFKDNAQAQDLFNKYGIKSKHTNQTPICKIPLTTEPPEIKQQPWSPTILHSQQAPKQPLAESAYKTTNIAKNNTQANISYSAKPPK